MKLNVLVSLPGGESRIIVVKGHKQDVVKLARDASRSIGGWIEAYLPKGGR